MAETTETGTPIIDLAKPYVGWLNHFTGWQAVLVYQRGGKRVAHRLGDEVSLERATETCHVLAEQAELQFAGELSKRDGFMPIALGGSRG